METETKRKFAKIVTSIPIIDKMYRLFNFRKVDVIINSFPKSGRTWLRVMLIRYLQLHFNLQINPKILSPMMISQEHPEIPNIVFMHGNENPFSKKPEELTSSIIGYKKKKFILLIRDPRDVIVSSFFQRTKRGKNLSYYNGTISEFLHQRRGSLDALLQFYNIWYENRSKFDKFLLIKYENFLLESTKEFSKILQFIGLQDIDLKKISNSIDFASFDNMQKMEKKGVFDNPILKPTNLDDMESYKTRSGKSGGYVNYLSKEDINYMNKKIEKILPKWFGY